MNKLRPCPFCGKQITDEDFCSGDGFPKGCDCIWETTTVRASQARWQKRPIEDGLLEACKQSIQFVKKWAQDYGDGEHPNAIGQRAINQMLAAIQKAEGEG